MPGSHRAGADRRGGGARRAGSQRRRRPRLRIVAVTGLSLLVLLAAGTGWVYHRLNGNISTFADDGLSRDRPKAGAGGKNVLVIGSDSRSGANKSLGGGEGDIGRSDTAFLLHVYNDSRHAAAVSFPRDALVDIPRCKLPDGSWSRERSGEMFNTAFTLGETAEGNPACTQNTVEKLTGLRVDHTVVVDFAGFSTMTEAVGGVPVCVPNDVYQGDLDPNRGARGKRVFAKGKQSVEGRQALDYVRLRHGIGDGSDIGRIQRQQAFISSLIAKIKDKGFSPGTLLPLADAATDALTVDEGLGTADRMMSFAMSLKDVDLHNTKFVTLPWRYQGPRVAVVESEAEKLWADLRADRPLDADAGSGSDAGSGGGGKRGSAPDARESRAAPSGKGISVAVHNGTGITGLAARGAGLLKENDFTVTGTGNAPGPAATTRVAYGPGESAAAKKTARLFPGAKVEATTEPGITVVLGRDYADNPQGGPTSGAGSGRGDGSGSGNGSGNGSGSGGSSASGGRDKARSADDDLCSGLSYG